ncbi:hypothetical protein SEPCBS57363_003792 [Sporothrix epigloea]|uniref:Uncharacterized protein n=1 Tax=Sporothrix epigloea TaxID=1892477 RepID=A0ABP0DQH0_9PEZI
MASKVIVLGSVNGRFAAAFKKLGVLHAKNQFACCIATGNLFGTDENEDEENENELSQLLNGQIEIPVTTYFTVGTRPFPARIAERLEKAAETDDDSLDGNEICPNLHYLGKRSVTKTAEGLRIVALGGLLVENDGAASADGVVRKGPSTDVCLPFHSVADEASLRGAHGADILLTAIWPRGIQQGSSQALPDTALRAVPSSDGLADLVAALRPRYHITSSPDVGGQDAFFYEREAFFYPERPDSSHSLAIDVTRFLSLASWGNTAKAKSLYAFGLSREAPTLVPAGCTPSPFLGRANGPKKRKSPLEAEPYSRFSQDGRGGSGRQGGGRHGKRSRRDEQSHIPLGPDRCFFCLSNPNLPTHMIASIGDDAYLATAKGPLPLPTTFAEQGLVAPPCTENGETGGHQKGWRASFPGHMIMVPLSHAATISAGAMHTVGNAGITTQTDGQQVASRTFCEMTRFRESLQTMVASRTQQRLGAVTWEISRQRNVHVHWQFVPVPADLVMGGLVEAAFRVEAANLELPPLVTAAQGPVSVEGGENENGEDYKPMEGDYFRVWIWAPTQTQTETKTRQGDDRDTDGQPGRVVGTTLVMHLDEGSYFDLQYGRRVVAKLLGLEATRTVWQDCLQTEAEEEADVAAFRAAYAPWDFTMAE